MNPAVTHCPRGHEYTPGNTLRNGFGWRHCRECNRVAARERWRRKVGKSGDNSPPAHAGGTVQP